MNTKRVTRYYAECGRGFWKKQPALEHEDNCTCWTNPKNKACKTCRFGEFAEFEHDTGYGGFWECNHSTRNETHNGAPKGITYISVHCIDHES